jgi:hypothetical protein
MAKRKQKSKSGLIQYESDERLYQLAEYAEIHLCSFRTALRHETLRRVLRDNNGWIPPVEMLAEMVKASGIECSIGAIARDLRSLGWKRR